VFVDEVSGRRWKRNVAFGVRLGCGMTPVVVREDREQQRQQFLLR
jgi:hypothetical protein